MIGWVLWAMGSVLEVSRDSSRWPCVDWGKTLDGTVKVVPWGADEARWVWMQAVELA